MPATAVQASQSGQFVFVVKAGSHRRSPRQVTVARQQGEEMIIAQGLAAGEEVVTDGQLRLTPGAQVTTGTRGEGPGGAPADGEGQRGSGRRATAWRRPPRRESGAQP